MEKFRASCRKFEEGIVKTFQIYRTSFSLFVSLLLGIHIIPRSNREWQEVAVVADDCNCVTMSPGTVRHGV